MNNLPMKQDKLNIFQRFRIRLYLMRKYNSSRFNDAPEYVKQDERVLRKMIKGEKSLSFSGNEKLIELFKTNPSLFDEESKNKVVEYALENRIYDIIFRLTDDEQYDIITSKKENQMFQYLSLNVVKKLISEKKFNSNIVFSFWGDNDYKPGFLRFCNLEVQIDVISQNKKLIQFASDDVQISYLKTHEKDIELVNSVVKNKFFRENISFLANHLEYMREADRETQLKLVKENRENLRYLNRYLQIEIIQKYPDMLEFASNLVKKSIFNEKIEEKINIIKILINKNPQNLKYMLNSSYEEKMQAELALYTGNMYIFKAKDIFVKYGLLSQNNLQPQISNEFANLSVELLAELVKTDSNYITRVNNIEKQKLIFEKLFGKEKLIKFEKYINMHHNKKLEVGYMGLLFNKDILSNNNEETVIAYIENILKSGDTKESREQFLSIIDNTYGEKATKILKEREELQDIRNISSLEIFDKRITNTFSEAFINDLLSYNIENFSAFLNIIKNEQDLELFKEYYSILSRVIGENVEVMQKAISEFYYYEDLLRNIDNMNLNESQQEKLICCLCSERNKYDIRTLNELDNYDEIANNEMRKEINELIANNTNNISPNSLKEIISSNILGLRYSDFDNFMDLYDLDGELNSQIFDEDENEILRIIKDIDEIDDVDTLMELCKKLMEKPNIKNPIAIYSALSKIKEHQIEFVNEQFLTKEKLDKICEEEKEKKDRKAYKEIVDGVEIYHLEGLDGNVLYHRQNESGTSFSSRVLPATLETIMELEKPFGVSTISTSYMKISDLAKDFSSQGNLIFSRIEPENLLVSLNADAGVTHAPKVVRASGRTQKIRDIFGFKGMNEVAFYRRIRNHKIREKSKLDGRIKPDFICVQKHEDGREDGKYSLEDCKKYGIPILVIHVDKYIDKIKENEDNSELER